MTSTEIVSFITPGEGGLVPGCDHKSHIVKKHYFFQKLLLYFWGWFRQTQTDSFDYVPIDSYSFVLIDNIAAFLLHYSLVELLI